MSIWTGVLNFPLLPTPVFRSHKFLRCASVKVVNWAVELDPSEILAIESHKISVYLQDEQNQHLFPSAGSSYAKRGLEVCAHN